ncbi:serine/threonine-protein kinase [Streptomyces boluensis]|uniref:PQQ-binding-like beta-propeller repeat protein n=1 Tax=Streptomyces boluensis TaxID=1775135 RepID=A0A964USY3_9ACTN|nr:serine/threonine-protein kinase [Streptomyces boluensis]NBE54858.1 PQQ-binding-like beta-propeller repeat protein [Streptomyces boluensis]
MRPLGAGDPLRLGPYRLLGVLGEGGMGKVYFGQETQGGTAAVKVLKPELAGNHNLAQRFVREARMAQAVTSAGVAQVLGARTEGGRPWIAIEFLTGPTLEQAVRSFGPLDDPSLRALAASVAATLGEIHAAGLIHRDLKPDNIVLTSEGPRVIDFGIARPEHGLTLTTTGQVPVTPGYGAPEQALGRRVGPAADVFSLGAVLAYAASGQRAFEGGHVAAVQYEVVHGEPQLAGISEELRRLITPCLAKDPAARPAPAELVTAFAPPPHGAERAWTHGSLAEDIKERERSVHELTTVVSGSGGASHSGLSRRRLITALAAGGTLVAGGGGAGAWWLRERAEERELAQARSARRRQRLFAVPPAAETPKARSVTLVEGQPPEPLWELPSALDKAKGDLLPVRDVLVVADPKGGLTAHDVTNGRVRWRTDKAKASSGYVALSDALIAALDSEGGLVTFVAATGEPRWTAPADGRKILAADSTAVYVLTKDGRIRSIARGDAGVLWTTRVKQTDKDTEWWPGAAGRSRLILATKQGYVAALDSASGRQVWDIVGQASADETAISPVITGDVACVNGHTLTARRLSDGKELWAKSPVVDGKTMPAGPPCLHDGTVYATQGPYLTGYDPSSGEERWKAPESYHMYSPVAVQGDGVYAFRSDEDSLSLSAYTHERRRGAWTLPLPDELGPHGLRGDGNRVFVRDITRLIALPAFA